MQSSKPIFQPTHLWEGDSNESDRSGEIIFAVFQPTHLWEGDSNSRSQNPCLESFSN
ncbi:hypothetical protein [Chamaesiphon sp. OTE_20_metabat_361]|uniref:hypothetical protein n=1 Tax=Chamaesiphon sp. OTE_20_metabat_361 TaxID=2964689 RepID=UPI00286A90EB|nr:hypothetical protein [Chamaesiphon sp. OTE_20_metabat_361]